MQTVTYAATDAILANPDRGVIAFHTPAASNDGTEWQGPLSAPGTRDYLEALRDETGATTVRVVYDIRDYREAPLSAETLGRIEGDFAAAREMGYKVAPQFTYGWVEDQQSDAAQDADADRIVAHLDQLAPLLAENTDVMSVMYAGFIGPWGEWHSSTAGNLDADDQVNDATRRIYDALMAAVPEEDFVALRYPVDRATLAGDGPFRARDAFGPSDAARTGLHDDAFLQNRYDDPDRTPEGVAYRAAIGPFTPSIEHLDLNLRRDGGPMLEGDAVLDALRSRGSDYVTDTTGWNPVVEGGDAAFEEATERVGYRFRLVEAELPGEMRAGGTLDYAFVIANDGFSAPYTERPVEIVLVDSAGAEVALALDADPRLWIGGEERVVAGALDLPESMAPGVYEAHLAFPDPHARIEDDPRYAIRLANEGVWEEDTGLNNLGMQVRVEAAGGPAPPPETIGASGTVSFRQRGPEAWTRVEFGVVLEDAVVVLGPPTSNGGQPTSVRVRNVDATGFEMQIDEWDYLDGRHASETIGWMAVEAGTHRLADGRTIQAGSAEAGRRWTEVDLAAGFAGAPAVFATVGSDEAAGALAPRLRNVETDGFRFRLDGQEKGGAPSQGVDMGWIAVEPGMGDVAVGAGRIDHAGDALGAEAAGAEVLLAAMQTTRGGDTATLRRDGPARVFVEEERSSDEETTHKAEDVAYLTTGEGAITGWRGATASNPSTPAAPVPHAARGEIVHQGEEVFPVGFYGPQWRTPLAKKKEAIDAIAAAGFNTVVLEDIATPRFDRLLERAEAADLGVIVGLTNLKGDGYVADTVGTHADAPAVMGWSLLDDGDNGDWTLPEIAARDAAVKALDDDHFTYLTLTGYDPERRAEAAAFVAAADVAALQVYPVTPLPDYGMAEDDALTETAARMQRYARAAEAEGKPFVMNAQTFAWDEADARFPSAEEFRNMAYAGLAAGATGIMAYDFSEELRTQETELWNEYAAIAGDVQGEAGAYYLDGDLARHQTGDRELVASHYLHEDGLLLIVVNTSTDEAKDVAIALPDGYGDPEAPYERMADALRLSDGAMMGSVAPEAVQVYELML